MNYDYAERSNQSAEPVALYEFDLGSKKWAYAQSETDVLLPSPYKADEIIRFKAMTIMDDGVSQSGVADEEDVHIHLPGTEPIAQVFRGLPPSEPVFVVIRRTNVGTNEAPVYWVGTVKSSTPKGKTEVDLTCKMLTASFNRQGLRLGWQRSCPYALYDQNCKVNKVNFRGSLTVTSMTGASLSGAALIGYEADRLTGGFIEWTTEYGSIERRAIEAQFPDSIVILEGTESLAVGMTVNFYPGCKLTIASCKSYNNLPNYGGYPMLPGKSPFDGNPVF